MSAKGITLDLYKRIVRAIVLNPEGLSKQQLRKECGGTYAHILAVLRDEPALYTHITMVKRNNREYTITPKESLYVIYTMLQT